jgi:hypothetical protein
MQKRGIWILSVMTIIMMVVLGGSLVFGEQTIEFKDGMVIKGEIQNKMLRVQTSFGKLMPPTDKIVFVSEGNVELQDGTKIMGNVVIDEQEGLVVKTKYGTWTLRFKPEDLQMITFQK